jgi:hypothetical protein
MTCLRIHTARSPRERRAFLDFPHELYRDDPRWVPPLARDEEERLGFRAHPFHEHSRVLPLLAFRGEEVVGRIAAIDNVQHNAEHGERRGFFGFFECRDDPEAARALVGAAGRWLASRGLTDLRGPMSPSIEHQAGLLVEGFDAPPSFLMPYNPPYYARLLEGCGLRKSQDLLAFQTVRSRMLAELPRLQRVGRRLAERQGVTFRRMRRTSFRQDLATFLSIVNRSLVGHWGHVPLSPAELEHAAAAMRWLLMPELVVFAEVAGEPIGVALALPDYNPRVKQISGRLLPLGFLRLLAGKRWIRSFRVVAANVLPEWKRSGIGVALTAEILRACLDRGAEHVEFSWIAESNQLSHGSLETGGAERAKTYRVYDCRIAAATASDKSALRRLSRQLAAA